MLGSFLNRRGNRDHVGQLILLSDVLTDGSFLIHHFITQALKDGHQTILISLSQSLLHYSSVSSKLGVNLHKKKDDGHFIFVDGVTSLLSAVFSTDKPQPSKTLSETHTTTEERKKSERLTISLDSNLLLYGAYTFLQELIASSRHGGPMCLLIDGLSVLLNVGVALREVVMFVQACTQLLTSSHGPCQGEGYLVVMTHCEEDGEEEAEDMLQKHLLHLCHLHLHAQGLKTGYSKDIHGEVNVRWRDPACTGQELPSSQSAQFKLTDRSIQLFAKGMSKAIL